MSAMASRRPSPSKAILTRWTCALRAMSGLYLFLETVRQIARERVQPLRPQQGGEIFVREELSQGLGHEYQPIPCGFRLANKNALLVGCFSIGPDQRTG